MPQAAAPAEEDRDDKGLGGIAACHTEGVGRNKRAGDAKRASMLPSQKGGCVPHWAARCKGPLHTLCAAHGQLQPRSNGGRRGARKKRAVNLACWAESGARARARRGATRPGARLALQGPAAAGARASCVQEGGRGWGVCCRVWFQGEGLLDRVGDG